jgi:hypothetical protein
LFFNLRQVIVKRQERTQFASNGSLAVSPTTPAEMHLHGRSAAREKAAAFYKNRHNAG